ncbi:ABC transporter substrate-binding protein [Paenibacillus sp. BSR1-1]|uniref:ABC transporter substrate-binding protein n=1 Tax=Paenibacillus sp. BSR1-1 TaxID=3020845 RepID=UPI0025B1F5DA|nr:ABC transporter substrate-binding protein [Paenibacillus sp. BSR1-1]MDN3016183.1 ABC transporter substrate-binding protein [Paenibacillus sp. BSR1-1]
MIKNKKQKFFTIILLIISLFTITACGNQSASTSQQGKNVSQGVTDKEILIGHLGPQTGPVAVYDYFRKGIDAYFKYVNENGGVNGRKLKLIAYDDQYQPSRTIKNAKRIVNEDKVFAMLGDPCTPCNSAARNIFEKAGIPMVMISSGAQQFVNPPIKNYFGSSILNYRVETRVFVDYAVNQLHAKKIGVVYQNDDYGKEGLTVLKDSKNIELVAEVPYVAGDTDLSTHAEHLNKAKPDAIMVLGGPTQAANLKKELYKIGMKDTPYIVSSVGANDRNLFKLAGKDVWEGTISAAAFPMPDVSNDPSMKTYVEQFKKYYPNDPIDGFAQNGWAIAEVLVEALNRTGKDLTWDNFFKALNSFDNWDGSIYEGVTFNKNNHYGLTTMILTQAKNGQILPLSGRITFDPDTTEITYEK